MNSLANIVQSETPSTGVQFRRSAYGEAGIRDYLRDVLAMANAPVDGARYIIVGLAFDRNGMRHFEDVSEEDFSGKINYETLANNYIEPPIRIRYKAVIVDGHKLGAYEISDCQDRPYMMRIDHSETLRRGDAYVRANDKAVKMGRRQLQSLFEQKFREAVSSDSIEVGFPGDIIHKDRTIAVHDLAELPSALAVAKLEEMLKIKSSSNARGSTTVLSRMLHARLFGPDDPYEHRSEDEIRQEIRDIESRYVAEDSHYLFENNADELQLIVYNQGEEAIRDASISIAMPNLDGFHVAGELPPLLHKGEYAARTPAEQSAYPSVKLTDAAVQVTGKVGDIEPGDQVDVFEVPLRICVARKLGGRRFALQYALHAQNLRVPAKGRLRLLFEG